MLGGPTPLVPAAELEQFRRPVRDDFSILARRAAGAALRAFADLSEQRHADESLRRSIAQRDVAVEAERGRIARELHIELGRALAALNMKLAGLGRRLGEMRQAWARPSICWLLGMALAQAAAANPPVRMAGTGAAVGAMELLIAEYSKARPDVIFRPVEAIGSSGAIRAVMAGSLDIALAARPLGDAERAAGASAIEYARTPFVIAVATKSPVKSISRAELARVYHGTLDSWPDDVRVRPVLRPADDIDTDHLRALSPEIAAALEAALKRPGMPIASTDREAADIIERTRGAIGPSSLGLIQSESRELRALALDGVQPTLQALQAGEYPHHKRLYMVTGKKLSPAAREFMEFVGSAAGRALLARSGHLVPPFKGR